MGGSKGEGSEEEEWGEMYSSIKNYKVFKI